MRWVVVVATGLGLLSIAAAEPSTRDAIAVFDIQVDDVLSFSPALVEKWSKYLDSVVTQSPLPTVPRSEIQARLVEKQKESLQPCFDEACQIDVGNAVAARKALSSVWARLGSSCTLSVKIYDLRTRLAEFSSRADGSCDEPGLRSAIEEIGRALQARGQDEYGAFKLALDEGRAIKNPPTDKTGYLKIKAEAKGRPSEKIEVYVNGALAGSFVGFYTKELPVGRYLVLLRTTGDRFQHQRFEIEMTPDGVQIPKTGLVQLEPIFGTLVIEGSPARATALIDGEPRAINGTLREELRARSYRVIIEASGYLPSAPQEAVVPPGDEIRISYNLVRNAGWIAVRASPADAQIVIDNASAGAGPVELELGDHVVEVLTPGHHPERRIASVRRGETTTIDVTLRPKVGRLRVEALAALVAERVDVEADVYLDGAKLGTTPWKGEVVAEVKHEVELRLGNERGPRRTVEITEGGEQRLVIETPSSWGGAVSTLAFDLVDGPWEVRSGPAVLQTHAPNPVRPGRLPIEFFLDGKRVGNTEVLLSPREAGTVVVTARPRTEAELASTRAAWVWRKWIATGLATGATIFGAQQLAAAHLAAGQRDDAYLGLQLSSVPEELDGYRAAVIQREDARVRSETIAAGALAAAVAATSWAVIEWLTGEPAVGALEGPGVVPAK